MNLNIRVYKTTMAVKSESVGKYSVNRVLFSGLVADLVSLRVSSTKLPLLSQSLHRLHDFYSKCFGMLFNVC